ncbi:hypothetical protein [Erwinia mallotivora]|uniref:hypothetical protein n=1 Tax=Erwinia mallotivora TaxID=69222 RepID=UPI0021BE62EE|nr:hypothetical protein [Erwinia mallotivora]
MKDKNDYIEAAQQIIMSCGLAKAQHNERSALCLLALLRSFEAHARHDSLVAYLAERETLVARSAKVREQPRIKVEIAACHLIHFNGVRFPGPCPAGD